MQFIASSVDVDTPDRFWEVFNVQLQSLRSLLGTLSAATENLSGMFVDIKENCTQLQNLATSSTSILPQYDIRRSQEVKQHANAIALSVND